jgi:hypothetical protein
MQSLKIAWCQAPDNPEKIQPIFRGWIDASLKKVRDIDVKRKNRGGTASQLAGK